MRIAVGSDHRGFKFKEKVKELLAEMGHETVDIGAPDENPVDYPDIAMKLGKAVTDAEVDRGVLICGTGIGMSMSANRVRGIRAALVHDAFGASRARQHNDANVLCIGAEREQAIKDIIDAFLTCEFEGGRHKNRLDKMSRMEGAG